METVEECAELVVTDEEWLEFLESYGGPLIEEDNGKDDDVETMMTQQQKRQKSHHKLGAGAQPTNQKIAQIHYLISSTGKIEPQLIEHKRLRKTYIHGPAAKKLDEKAVEAHFPDKEIDTVVISKPLNFKDQLGS